MKKMINSIKIIITKLKTYYNNANVAVKASLWFTICSIVQKGISVLTLPVFTRLMTTEQFGQYSVFLTWYNILVIVITLNVQSEIFNKGLIDHSSEKDKYAINQAGLILALGIAFLIIYVLFRNLFNNLLGLTTTLVIFMVFEILGSAIITLWSARKRFDYDYMPVVSLTIGMAILNPLIGILSVLFFTKKAEARIISNAIIPIIISIILIANMKKKGKLFSNFKWWGNAITATLPLVPHYLSLVLLNQSDKLMIDFFSGASETAIYSIAHSAGLLMTIVNSSINSSFVPWAYTKMKYKNGKGIKNVANILCFIVMGVNTLMIWMAPEVIKLLAAPQYSEAVWCLVPIASSVYFFFVYTMVVDIEIYYGATKYIAIASVCAAVINIVLNYLFIPVYGYIAAGYTTLFSYFATMLLHFVFLRYLLRKNDYTGIIFDTKAIFLIAILMISLSFLAMQLYKHFFIRIIILIVFCVIIILKKDVLLDVYKKMKN